MSSSSPFSVRHRSGPRDGGSCRVARATPKLRGDRYGLTVLIDQTDGLPDRERLVVSGIRPHLIDGLIFSPLGLGKADLRAADLATPLVLLGERIFDGGADHVAIDNVAAAEVATKHLIGLGRRRIAAIGAQGFESGQTAHLRLAGYREALSGSGMAEDPQLIAAVDALYRADEAEAMSRLLELDDSPDAVSSAALMPGRGVRNVRTGPWWVLCL